MRIKDIYPKLQKILNNDCFVVEAPDHPYLLKGPDYLIAHPGKLTGIFVPHRNEINSPDRLLARLSLSRLAYPNHMKCILLVNQDIKFSDDCFGVYDTFHEVVASEQISDIKLIFDDSEVNKRLDPIPLELKEKVFNRSQIFLFESTKFLDKESSKKPEKIFANYSMKKAKVYSWIDPGISKNMVREIYEIDDDLIAFKEFNKTRTALNQLNNLVTFSTLYDYKLDKGVPYLVNKNMKFLSLDSLPQIKTDPLKVLRASSFAGWIIINTNDFEEVQKVSSKMRSKYEKKI